MSPVLHVPDYEPAGGTGHGTSPAEARLLPHGMRFPTWRCGPARQVRAPHRLGADWVEVSAPVGDARVGHVLQGSDARAVLRRRGPLSGVSPG